MKAELFFKIVLLVLKERGLGLKPTACFFKTNGAFLLKE